MGRKRDQRKASNKLDSSDDDSLSSASTALSDLTISHETERVNSHDFLLDKYLDALYEKRASTRENALEGLVKEFEGNVLLYFVENKFVTFLHQYISSVKKGSSKEASLACRAIGLLSLTVGDGSYAHEIMEESFLPLSQAVKSGSDIVKKSIMECVALTTFVGANDLDETEKSMKVIWEVIHPKSGSNFGTVIKPSAPLLATAVSAWSFLLTTVSDWRISSTNWKESVSFLSTLLDKEDRSIRIAAGEALAVIFEIGKLDKISKKDSEHGSSESEGSKAQGFVDAADSLRGKILMQARKLSAEAAGKGTAKKDLSNQRDLFLDILVYLETGDRPEVSMKISNKWDTLKVSTWSDLIQLNFLKRFLGSGFLKHMQENELLHDVFSFWPEKMGNPSIMNKKMFMTINSAVDKERTRTRNKYRMWAQDRNQGQFSVTAEDV